MITLAIDTAGKHGGVALYRQQPRLLASVALQGGTYSAELVPRMQALLASDDLALSDVQGLVIVNGPGSFTGLRVGIGAVKALAEARKLPIATVSTLELVASQEGHGPGRVLAALDAGRHEAYVGDYQQSDDNDENNDNDETNDRSDQQVHCRGEELLTWEQLAVRAQELATRVLTPDAPLADFLAGQKLAVFQCERLGSEQAALLGFTKLKLGHTVPVETLDANYLRRSDAEIFSLPKIQDRKSTSTTETQRRREDQ